MEALNLTTPISIASYQVRHILLDWAKAQIKILVMAPGGQEVFCSYEGSTATTFMTQLNKLDLSSNSLHKRVLERLVTDGKLPAGTVSGSPD